MENKKKDGYAIIRPVIMFISIGVSIAFITSGITEVNELAEWWCYITLAGIAEYWGERAITKYKDKK